MAAAATTIYTGDGLEPCWAPEEAILDAVQLVPGTYSAGQVIGQYTAITAANDVQTLTVTGTPTGGSLIIGFNGDVSAPVLFNSTLVQFQAILDAMPQIGAGGSVATGGPLPGTPFAVTFSGTALAGRLMPNFTIISNGLTGGASPAGAWVHTTPGTTLGGAWASYNDALSDGTNIAKAVLKFAGVVNTFGSHAFGGGEWGSKTKSAPAFFKGYFKTAELVGVDANGCADLGRIVRGNTSNLTNQATVLAMF